MDTDEQNSRYRTVRRSVRPTRAVTFVEAGLDWRADAMRMLEGYSRTWGGDGNGLVSYHRDAKVAEPFWPLLAAFDPDYWLVFARSLRGLQISNPLGFEAEISERAAAWAQHNGVSVAEARELLETDQFLTAPAGALETPLDDRIRRRHSPLASPQVVVHGVYQADEPPPHGLVDMCELTYLPEQVTSIDASDFPLTIQLLVAAQTGALSPRHASSLDGRYRFRPVAALAQADQLDELLEFAWTGRVDAHASTLASALAGAKPPDLPEFASPGFAAETPLAHTRVGCNWLTRATPHLYREPIVVVCGDTADDFCFAYTRQRAVGLTYWLPLSPTVPCSELDQRMCDTLARILSAQAHGAIGTREIHFSSLTFNTDELEAIRGKLKASMWGRSFDSEQPWAAKTRACPANQLAAHRHRVLLDSQHFNDTLFEPFQAGVLVRDLDLPRPAEAVGQTFEGCHWRVDFEVPDHVLPARWALGPHLVEGGGGAGSGWFLRSSTAGISVPSHGLGGVVLHGIAEPRQLLLGSKLRFPDARETFAALLAQSGATLEESDKGRYTRRMLQLWGGLRKLAVDLRTGPPSVLLRLWAADPKASVAGCALKDNRRYLTLADVSHITGLAMDDARTLLDDYLRRSIVSRGLVLKCGLCTATCFYRIEEVAIGFRCQRCRQANEITRSSWINKEGEPAWFYGLDEVAFQGITNDIHVPILALDEIGRSARSLLHMPEVVVKRPGSDDLEVDIWAIIDGRIVIGEAKVGDKLENTRAKEAGRADRLGALLRDLGADEFVMATEKDQWHSRTRGNVERAIEPHAKVTWLTGLRRADAPTPVSESAPWLLTC